MALKTFNVDHELYKAYSKHCKENGISMSKKVENFIRLELEGLGIDEKKSSEKEVKQKSEKRAEHNSFSRFC